MTADRENDHDSKRSALLGELKRRGIRITPQREMIVEAIAGSDRHLTADEIYEDVRTRTRAMNVATVYRTLDLLVAQGMVSRIDVGHDRVLYATDGHGPHIHLVCRRCGREKEAESRLATSLARRLRADHGFEADLRHISLSGVCADCGTHA